MLTPYTRSLFFVLYKAVSDLYPQSRLQIDSHVSNGFYCHISHVRNYDADLIKERMRELIRADLPFEYHQCPKPEAISLFRLHGQENKALLLESTKAATVEYYTLDGTPNSFYGKMLERTGQIHTFDLMPYDAGLLLRLPARLPKTQVSGETSCTVSNYFEDETCEDSRLLPFRPEPMMLSIFREYHRWQTIMGLSTVGEMNIATLEGRTTEMINVAEAIQEKKIIKIADQLAAHPELKVVLIAGPSCSGKTTFSKRLTIQLQANGLKPETISLDNYFVDREKTPKDEQGNYDFECIGAMQTDRLNHDLAALLRGEEVELPNYNFKTGLSEQSGKFLRLQPETVLILEGIHALNPILTEQIPREKKFLIFASALTTILLDDHNYIATQDNRLLRCMVRDNKFRGYSALDTLRRWPNVLKGEEKWLVPFQEQADEMINTALLFELASLRDQALPLLDSVPEDCPEHKQAERLTRLLRFMRPIPIKALPPTSLLREFMGGSTFSY